MYRAASQLLGPGCALVLTLVCFHAMLFRGQQFAYRDAGHSYDPLYRVVEQDWEAGRWPLWNSRQNGGTPLLGMPMAAVLYPGKLLYALLPYHLAARVYIVAHTVLAWLGMLSLDRTLGLSRTGAFLGAISYGFGAPILSLHSNVIFLVGAAWAPWGFRSLHRFFTPGNRWGLLELGLVLAMQVLGGDPEAAYLTVAAGALYAGVLCFGADAPTQRNPGDRRAVSRLALAAMLAWFLLVCEAALSRWSEWIPGGGSGWLIGPMIGMVLAILVLARFHREKAWIRLGTMLAGLAGAGLLGLLLAAV